MFFDSEDKVTNDYMNGFVDAEYQITEYTFKSNLTKAEVKEKYPEWYYQNIYDWRLQHTDDWEIDCERENGLSHHTILK